MVYVPHDWQPSEHVGAQRMNAIEQGLYEVSLAQAAFETGAGLGHEYVIESPASVWGPIAHGLGRRPIVTTYLGGEVVAAFVTADSTHVTISFPSPVIGSVVLN